MESSGVLVILPKWLRILSVSAVTIRRPPPLLWGGGGDTLGARCTEPKKQPSPSPSFAAADESAVSSVDNDIPTFPKSQRPTTLNVSTLDCHVSVLLWVPLVKLSSARRAKYRIFVISSICYIRRVTLLRDVLSTAILWGGAVKECRTSTDVARAITSIFRFVHVVKYEFLCVEQQQVSFVYVR